VPTPVEQDEAALRQRLAEVEERIDRIGRRFAAGYGGDADRDSSLAWLRDLEARRTALVASLEGRSAPPPGDAL